MKFFSVFVALALVLSVSAAPSPQQKNVAQNAQNNKGGNNNNNNQNNGKGNQNGNGNNNNNKGGANNGNNGGNGGANNDPQTSLTLDPKVIATGFANNGQDQPTAGQVASLTSTNNFINFCLTVPNLPITNGKQITTGSCNPAPMGVIPSTDNMPSCKFVFPKNGDVIKSNTAFTVQMAINNLETGNFVNAQENYFSAPQQLNGQGKIKGHSHIVIEQMTSFQQTTPTNPKVFAFFKGLNDAAKNGQLTASVDKGLPAGTYKVSSINTAANHQPALVPIAQHGSLDDAVYFTVTDDGKAPANNPLGGAAAAGNNNAGNANQGAQGGNQAAQQGGNKAGNNQGAQQNGNNNNQAAQQNGQKGAAAQGQNGNNKNNNQAAQQNGQKAGAQQNGNNNQQQNQNQQKGQQQNNQQKGQQQNNQQQLKGQGKGKRSRLSL